jgi:hypothetical protein
VRPERSGWRDERISLRHRAWGWDCPAVDVDFLLLEYDAGRAAALVEYKHEDAQIVRLAHPSIRAIADLAERADLPAFVVRYGDDFSWWYPTPLTDRARALLPEPGFLSEREWMGLLYRCRGRRLPAEWSQQA